MSPPQPPLLPLLLEIALAEAPVCVCCPLAFYIGPLIPFVTAIADATTARLAGEAFSCFHFIEDTSLNRRSLCQQPPLPSVSGSSRGIAALAAGGF